MSADTLEQRLAAALAAEHAAIYAYGRLGVLLDKAGRDQAHAAETAHRSRRDAALLRLEQLGATSPGPEAGYELPFPLTDAASALKLALHVEDAVSATWRAVLPAATGPDRSAALAAYSAAAVQATKWRRSGKITPLTVSFPGRPA